jgi:hypothetical protein
VRDTNELKYVLYARKSSESDERQAMSIDGQLMEMKQKAKREKINIVEIVKEKIGILKGSRSKFGLSNRRLLISN